MVLLHNKPQHINLRVCVVLKWTTIQQSDFRKQCSTDKRHHQQLINFECDIKLETLLLHHGCVSTIDPRSLVQSVPYDVSIHHHLSQQAFLLHWYMLTENIQYSLKNIDSLKIELQVRPTCCVSNGQQRMMHTHTTQAKYINNSCTHR